MNYNVAAVNPKTKELEYFNLPIEFVTPLFDKSMDKFKVIPVDDRKEFYRD